MNEGKRPPSNLRRIQTHISGIERAFGDPEVFKSPADSDAIDQANEMRKQVMKDREQFIKLYQPAAMSYLRGVLTRISGRRVVTGNDVGAVWSNLVTRLLSGEFTTFKHRGREGSFRNWIRPVIANECKAHVRHSGLTMVAKGPRNAVDLGQGADVEPFDPEDRTLESVLRKTVIDRAYQAMEDDRLSKSRLPKLVQREPIVGANEER